MVQLPATMRAVVTGGSAGIGAATVRQLAAAGHRVVLAARDVAKGDAVAVAVRGDVEVRRLDLSDLSSVLAFAAAVGDEAVDVLINNAGVMGGPYATTVDGFERQIGTNHLGHFALTLSLLPPLLASPRPVVVNVTSIAAARGRLSADPDQLRAVLRRPEPYVPMDVYGTSKLANQVFAVELDLRAAESGWALRAVAAHPGVSATGLFSANLRNRGMRLLPSFIDQAQRVVFQPAAAGAACSVEAALRPPPPGEMVGPGGPAQWRGQPTHLPLLPAALDRAVGRGLWEVSVEATGVDLPGADERI